MGEEEEWLYMNLSLSSFLPRVTRFIELREIMFFKIEMTVRVWESLWVSTEFSFFSLTGLSSEEDVIFFKIEIMSNFHKFVESNSL